ncbi:hypothetical protein B484DRAFT_408274 [Ochromonadaceae sp. CCMP2298]|nr:hypothetical protein B484DRAFT_408274 [Ochromonadaceae sp. CCMP2298]
MSFSIQAMLTSPFTTAPPALQALMDVCGAWTATDCAGFRALPVADVELEAFIVLPVSIPDCLLPEEVTELTVLHDKQVVILKLRILDEHRLFVEVVSGRELIATHLPQGCAKSGAGGGTEAGAGAHGTQGGTGGRSKRNRDSGEDGEDETNGDFMRDGFLERYGGDLIVDVVELVRTMEGYSMDSSGLVEGHSDYRFRMSALLLSLRVLQYVEEGSAGLKTYPTLLAAAHCDYDPFDLRVISLFSFLPPGEGQAVWFAKGVRSAAGRGLVAASFRNHGIFWQALSCEAFATATAALTNSLLNDVHLWQRIDNVVILANCTRMLSRYYVDLRSQAKSVSFPDTPMACGAECAVLLGLYEFYVLQFGLHSKLRLPSFSPAIKEKTEREGAAAKAAAAATLKQAKVDAASRGGGDAVCKAALCGLLDVKNGKGVSIACTRRACRFRHPEAVGEITQAEADAAASVVSIDPTLDANLRAKCRTRKGWKTDA